jgi:sugar phosphate permease
MRLIIGSCVMAIAGNALLTWAPAYLMRSFELTPAQAGGRLGIAFAIGAVIGPLLGGAISDRLFKRRGNAGPMLVLIACSAATAVCYAMLPFAASVFSAASLIATVSVFYSAVLSVSASAIQQRAPAGLRARISALWLCLNTLVGLGLGSLLVGVVTDYVFGTPTAVGASLACVAFVASVVGGAFIATLLKRRT